MAMILGAIGAVASTIVSISQLQYQAAIAKANAEQQRVNAEASRTAAAEDVKDIGEQRRGELGELRVSQAASGLSISSPSFARGEIAFGERAKQEQFRLQLAGNQQSTYYENAARIYDAEAKGYKAAIGPTILGGFINVAQSLVGGATATARSPGFLPIPQRRNTINAGVGVY